MGSVVLERGIANREDRVYNGKLSSVEDYVFGLVADEFVRAQKRGSFHSGHEGYAVILEEV